VHWLTPESQWTTHYFWAATRDRLLGDATVAAQVKRGIDEAFRYEDEPMIEDVQRNMGSSDLWDGQPVLLSIDNAPVRARRIVEKLLVTERDKLTVRTA
jgi:vanillate O-demethylase monooxygenase subunit